MIKTTQATYLDCDGCSYSLTDASTRPPDANSIRSRFVVLTVPVVADGREHVETFHFHAPNARGEHDCLRAFVTTPRYVERALEQRGYPPDVVSALAAQLGVRKVPS